MCSSDLPAACATLGVNLLTTRIVVFALSAAIAGFGGALLGVLFGSAGTQDFQMLKGLAYVLLMVVGGVAVVSGAFMGGIQLVALQVWIPTLVTVRVFGVSLLQQLQRFGPGLAAIAVGRQPAGVIPTVGHDVRANKKRRRARAGGSSSLPPAPVAAEPKTPAGAPEPDKNAV